MIQACNDMTSLPETSVKQALFLFMTRHTIENENYLYSCLYYIKYVIFAQSSPKKIFPSKAPITRVSKYMVVLSQKKKINIASYQIYDDTKRQAIVIG